MHWCNDQLRYDTTYKNLSTNLNTGKEIFAQSMKIKEIVNEVKMKIKFLKVI